MLMKKQINKDVKTVLVKTASVQQKMNVRIVNA